MVLRFHQCPGDTLVATASLECLHKAHPGRFLTSVEGTGADAIFDHNPLVSRFDKDGVKVVQMENPLINEAHLPRHFLESYCVHLGRELGVTIPLAVNRPYLYLSPQERSWTPRIEEVVGRPEKYWLVNAGHKSDYTVKAYPREYYQSVVDHFRGRITFVQVGEAHHDHKPLDGVIDEIGKTDLRQLIRMAAHPLCQGVLTPESFLWHLAAAFQKPAVCVASGFLPASWVQYPTGRILSKHGCLPCCRERSCWKARVVPLGDGDHKDKSLCELPVIVGGQSVGKCMGMIQPREVIDSIQAFYDGGVNTV